MRAHGSPLYLADTAKRPGRAGGQIADHLAQETALIEASLAMANPLTVKAVAEHLAKARRVRLAGFRNSRFAADYARAALAQFRPGVEMLNASGQTLAEGMAGIGAGDMVLIVGLRRRPAGFTDFVRAAAATGADVALLSDGSVREAPALARWNLTCAVTTPQLLDSYVGALAVLRLLAVATLQQLGADGRRHLEKIETIHEELSELE
jgi:DNA-binding MurR/RpiR family transcriptional regulator